MELTHVSLYRCDIFNTGKGSQRDPYQPPNLSHHRLPVQSERDGERKTAGRVEEEKKKRGRKRVRGSETE